MNGLPDPGIKVLVCASQRLTEWGDRGVSFRAPYWRLYRNDRTGANVIFGGRTMPLVKDRIYVIPPETDFYPDLRAPVRHFYIHFTANPPYDRILTGVYNTNADPALVKRSRQIEESLNKSLSLPDGVGLSMSVFTLITASLCNIPGKCLTFRPPDPRIERARVAILDRIAAPLSCAELATIASMAPNAFIRRFHEVVGESPQSYARRQRIERACHILHSTADSIDQVAEATGFCDRHHFSRVFKRMRGTSPAAFRRMISFTGRG